MLFVALVVVAQLRRHQPLPLHLFLGALQLSLDLVRVSGHRAADAAQLLSDVVLAVVEEVVAGGRARTLDADDHSRSFVELNAHAAASLLAACSSAAKWTASMIFT